MDEPNRDTFVQLLTGAQTSLFSYIAMLIGDVHDANNVLQQANLVLWRKADEYSESMDFTAWSRKVAYYSTLAYIRDQRRDKHVFDEAVIAQLAARPVAADEDEVRVALRHCLASLPEDLRTLIRERYWPGSSITAIAKKHGKSEGAIRMTLMRVRTTLGNCIERKRAATL